MAAFKLEVFIYAETHINIVQHYFKIPMLNHTSTLHVVSWQVEGLSKVGETGARSDKKSILLHISIMS